MEHDSLVEKLRGIFRTEAGELLEELESALLELEDNNDDSNQIDRVFRSLHTLKGSGATSGFQDLSAFLHQVEDLFSHVREGAIPINSELIDLTLKIKDLVERYLEGEDSALSDGADVLEKIKAYLPGQSPETQGEELPTATTTSDTHLYRIHFAPHEDFFRFGNDPLIYLDDLRALGNTKILAKPDSIPSLDKMDLEAAYLIWEIELETEVSEAEIEEVFAFAIDECELRIEELFKDSSPDETDSSSNGEKSWNIQFESTKEQEFGNELLQNLIGELSKLGRIEFSKQALPDASGNMTGSWELKLLECQAEEAQVLDAFLFTPITPTVSPLQSLEKVAANTPVDKAKRDKNKDASESMRVSTEKLDRLVNMVGELVILKSQLNNACQKVKAAPPELESTAEGLERLTLELRDLALDVRTNPIGHTFNRFKRTARDISRDLGKQVQVSIEGAETSMDKTVIDSLKDPLVHLVRNCIDHGIESPEERHQAGKPEMGTLRLAARQEGDSVRITVGDDGRGMDPTAIRTKAIERGLMREDQQMPDDEVLQMIFQPGFSTKTEISQLSGRGVGLDVVRRQIEQLRGSVELSSDLGKGSSITLTLPLTLAIIEGLLVRIEEDQYVFPLSIIQETFEFNAEQRLSKNQRNVVDHRGELLPYIDLRPLFGYDNQRPEREKIVIVELEGQKLGLVVDAVIGNHQTVLKSLGWASSKAKVFSGSTVLGNGRVGLICDIPAIVERAGGIDSMI